MTVTKTALQNLRIVLLLPGTMCSIPTVVIIYKLVLSWLSFICLLCISCFPKELLDLARLPGSLVSLDQSTISGLLSLFLLGNSFADGCLLPSANLKLFLMFYSCWTALLSSFHEEIYESNVVLLLSFLSGYPTLQLLSSILCCVPICIFHLLMWQDRLTICVVGWLVCLCSERT